MTVLNVEDFGHISTFAAVLQVNFALVVSTLDVLECETSHGPLLTSSLRSWCITLLSASFSFDFGLADAFQAH